MLLTGRHITAAEAKDYGLIGYVVPDGTGAGEGAGDRRGRSTTTARWPCRRSCKSIRETEGMHENEAFKIDTKIGIEVFLSDDAKEGPRRSRRSASPNSR